MQGRSLIIFSILSFNCFLSSALSRGYSQSLNHDFVTIERWRFPNEVVTGYIFDAFIDSDEQLALMFFRDGIKVVSSHGVENLTRVGQGPGEMQRWAAMFLMEPFLIDIENSGKLIYFRKQNHKYGYEKTLWLRHDFNFPHVKGAVYSNGKWYLAGFSSKLDNKGNRVHGYYLSIYKNGRQTKRLLFKDFKGLCRGPYFLAAHIRHFNNSIWMMLASELQVYVFDIKKDILIRKIFLKLPAFYKKIQDYIPFKRYPLEKLIQIYESWELSYSRVENFLITEKNLIIQIRTADSSKSKFALLFYNSKHFNLEKTYYCDDLLLCEKDGRFYFFEYGDPGLDEKAQFVSIKIYREK